MALTGLGFTGFWYSDDMEEQVVVSNGEFLLLNVNTRRAEKLGGSIDEAQKTLKALGKLEDFSDIGLPARKVDVQVGGDEDVVRANPV